MALPEGDPAVIDAARRRLADFRLCPSCGALLPGERCPACGVDLSGPAGRRVADLSRQAVAVLDLRGQVIRALQQAAQAVPARSVAVPARHAPEPSVPPLPPLPPVPPASPAPAAGAGLGVHGLLVGLGALLLAVAAVGFLVFSWRVLPLGGRSAVIAVATLGVLATATWLRARLPETAEAVGGLGVVLVLGDCWAIRRTGLFDADHPDGLLYGAAAAAVAAVLLAGWGRFSGVRAGSLTAAVLAPLSVVLAVSRADGRFGGVLAVQAGLVLAAGLTLGRPLLPARWRAERWILRAVAAGALAAAGAAAGAGAPGSGRAAGVLAVAAVVAAAGAFADRDDRLAALTLRRGWSLAAGLLAGTAAARSGLAVADGFGLTRDWTLVALVVAPVTLLPATALIPARPARPIRLIRPARPAPAVRRCALAAGTALVALVSALPVAAVAGRLMLRASLLAAPAWTGRPGQRLGGLESPVWSGGWAAALIGLLIFGAGTALAVRIAGWPAWLRRPAGTAAGTALGLALVALPLGPAVPVGLAVVGLGLVAVAMTMLAARVSDRGNRRVSDRVAVGGWTVAGVSGTLAVVLAWSGRELSGPATAAGIAALLLARRRVSAAEVRVVLAGLAGLAAPFAVLAALVAAGASMRSGRITAGLVGGLVTAALVGLPCLLPSARPVPGGRAPWGGADRLAAASGGLIALAAGLLPEVSNGTVGREGDWAGPGLLVVALLLALTAALAARPQVTAVALLLPGVGGFAATPLLGALVASSLLAAGHSPAPSLLLAAAALAGASAVAVRALTGGRSQDLPAELGLLLTGAIALALVEGADQLWPVLLLLGAGASAVAATPGRARVGWLAGVLLTGSTWTRLLVGDVGLVEAYSLPPAAALLGLAWFRVRSGADPGRALLPVAAVGVTPSVIVAAQGPAVRPGGLLVLGALLVAAGWWIARPARSARPVSSTSPAITAALSRLAAVVVGLGAGTAAATALARAGWAVVNGWSGPIEVWTGPAAVVVLLAGVAVPAALPAVAGPRSWSLHGPGLVLLLGPGLLLDLTTSGSQPVRAAAVIALAAGTLWVGAVRRLQAPVVLGALVLVVQAVQLLAPWIAVLPEVVPLWGWIAVIGLGLILLGARYEARVRQLKSIQLRLAALG
jgi:hypothetical protein